MMLVLAVSKHRSFWQELSRTPACCRSQIKMVVDWYVAEQCGAGNAKPGRKTDFSQSFINTKQPPW